MKRLPSLVIVSFSLMLSLPASSATLEQMSELEQKSCGIEKLSTEEKQTLNCWLAKLGETKTIAPQLHKNKTIHGEFVVKATDDAGRYVTLDNDLTYQIHSRSRKKTMNWKAGDKICLIEPFRPAAYKLENSSQKQTVSGKQVPTPPKVASTPE